MTHMKHMHISYSSYVVLYPALVQDSKEQISLPSPNTRKEQLYVRKVIKRHISHYGELDIFKTIVLDARFIKRSLKNIKQGKSFHHVSITISEPAVFELIKHVLHELSKKVIFNLDITFVITNNNSKSISKLIEAIQQLTRPKILNLTFESTQVKDFSDCLPVIHATLERIILLRSQTYINFKGASVYLVKYLAENMRYWNSHTTLSLIPNDLREPLPIEISNLALVQRGKTEERFTKRLQIKFWQLKKFGDNVLIDLSKDLNIFKKTGNLCLVLNRFELTKLRSETIGKYLQQSADLSQLEIIIYYLKYQKMNYEPLLEAIGSKEHTLEKLVLGYMVMKEDFYKTLSKSLQNLSQLKSLAGYWDIGEVLNLENFWAFLEKMEKLNHIEMILTCSLPSLDDEQADLQLKLEKNIQGLFNSLKVVPNLKSLNLVFPQMTVEIGEKVNDLIVGNKTLEIIKISSDTYNVNYLKELKDIQKIRQVKTIINTEQRSVLEEINNEENFKLSMYRDPYKHFIKINEDFFNRYIK